MLSKCRKHIKSFWRKAIIYVTVLVMLIQPGLMEQLLAAGRHAKDIKRMKEQRARAFRTYINPYLPTGWQQKAVCRKQLELCHGALSKLKQGRNVRSLIKDMKVLQDKLKLVHLNLMTDLSRMESKLMEKTVSDKILKRHEQFCQAVEKRYRKFDRLLRYVQSNRDNNSRLSGTLKYLSEFLSKGKSGKTQGTTEEKPRTQMPRHAACFESCQPGRFPYFQWPWMFAADDDIWCHLPVNIQGKIADGPPDTNDLKCDSIEVNFDPNDQNDVITAKANELGKSPVRIFEYVRNELVYEPYFGSVKGAKRTLAEGGGNDMDLASCLIAFLRASDIPCRYVCGTIELSVEEAARWTGVKDPKKVVELFQNNGICIEEVRYGAGEPEVVVVNHVWVKAYVDNFPYRGSFRESDYQGFSDGDAWIDMDPSFKQHTFTANSDIEQSIRVDSDPDTLLTNACFDATIVNEPNEKYVFGLDEDLISEQLMLLAEPVRNYLAGKNLTTEKIFRQRHVSEERYGLLSITDQYKILNRTEAINFNTLPEDLRHHLTITIKNPENTEILSTTKSLPELVGKKITLLYEPADEEDRENLTDPNVIDDPNLCEAYIVDVSPRLKIADELVPDPNQAALSTTLGSIQKLIITFNSPNGTVEPIVNEVVAGGMYSLVLDPYRITGEEVKEHYSVASVRSSQLDANDTLLPEETIGEVLHGIGLSYLHQLDRFNQISAGSLGLASVRMPSMITVGWDLDVLNIYGDPNLPYLASSDGVSISVLRDVHTATAIEQHQQQTFDPEDQFLFTSALTASALENNVLTQTLGQKSSASVARTIQKANVAAEPNIAIYTVTDVNEANCLTTEGGALSDLPDYVKQDIKNGVYFGCEVTIPEKPIQIADTNYVGYIKRDIYTSASDFIMYDTKLGKKTGSKQKNDSITPLELLLETGVEDDRYDEIGDIVESTASWLKIAEGTTTNAGLSYLPAIVDINRWFKTRTGPDSVTTVASVISVISPIRSLFEQAGIFNVQAGAGCNGEIGKSCCGKQISQTEWVGIDSNEFIIQADITHDASWSANIYKYGQNEPHFDPCTGSDSQLNAVFKFSEPNDGYYRYKLTAGSDANSAIPVEGTFNVDLTEPNATITDVNTPDSNSTGVFIVNGIADDEYFSKYKVSISQDGNETVIFESGYPVDTQGVLCNIGTADFNEGSADVILHVHDLAGNIA